MYSKLRVLKRDGSLEQLDINKIHKVVEFGVEDLEDVSASEIELKSQIQFHDQMKTTDIHEIITKSAADLITAETPNYQYVAARLAMFDIRKQAYGDFAPPPFYEHIKNLVDLKKYDASILKEYTKEEIEEFEKEINHELDMLMSYAGVLQLKTKYLVQDRITKRIYESPQYAYMLIAMCLLSKYDNRKELIKKFYRALSTHKISLPTPIMAGVRTLHRQYSSCVLIEAGDSLDSICAANTAIIKYISKRAGIGLNFGSIRAVNSPIRNGEAAHTGLIPFIKTFAASVKSCSQGAIRGGAATAFYPLWHYEVQDLLVLKNNRGVEENRERRIDYSVQINKLMYERLLKDDYISLFSPSEVPGLYDAFFKDQEEFNRLYELYEKDESVRKQKVKAVELFTLLFNERASTGRIYIQNVDNTNNQGPFISNIAPIKMSNLCVAPETLILTDKGYKEIKSLVGKKINVWNGEEWSETEVFKTGENKKLINIAVQHDLSSDKEESSNTLSCTFEHDWYLEDGSKIKAKDLKIGDKLLEWVTPEGNVVNSSIFEITEREGLHDTYCFTEPKRHMGVFNGILTGQCKEITLPTKPLEHKGKMGEIALCTLAAFNLGKLDQNNLGELEELAELLVFALDALLDYQDYPMDSARIPALARRSLGIGVINYAYYLAKNNSGYTQESAKELTHDLFEAIQFYSLKASNKLAKLKGACEWFDETKYSQGLLTIDTYKKQLDTVYKKDLQLDWESLRKDIATYGLRNSTLTALMPSETSSQISNATNGIEPPRGLVSTKGSKEGAFNQVVPEIETLRNKYELLWSIKDNKHILNLAAIMQKFIDQSISTNTNYDPLNYPGGKVPMQVLLGDLLYAYKLGIKTLYYHNTRDNGEADEEGNIKFDFNSIPTSKIEEDDGCESGGCKI